MQGRNGIEHHASLHPTLHALAALAVHSLALSDHTTSTATVATYAASTSFTSAVAGVTPTVRRRLPTCTDA